MIEKLPPEKLPTLEQFLEYRQPGDIQLVLELMFLSLLIVVACVYLSMIVYSMVKWTCPNCGRLNMKRTVTRYPQYLRDENKVLCDKLVECPRCGFRKEFSYEKTLRKQKESSVSRLLALKRGNRPAPLPAARLSPRD
jgi:predicted RNA-binding Zn-ribbon protein involved in translation (DUF1610 family)